MRCQNCGKVAQVDDLYCGFCGTKLGSEPFGETQERLDLVAIQYRLAIIYLKKGDFRHAIEKFKKILQKEPNNIRVKELLTQTEQALKETQLNEQFR
jgi:Tfp pilus assembly protein PilF